MAQKPKIEVIELDLGIDLSQITTKPKIKPATKQKIEKKIESRKREVAAIKSFKERKDTEKRKKGKIIEEIYKKMTKLAANNQGLDQDTLLKLTDSTNLISVMFKLRKLIQERGDLWIIQKFRRKGKITYRFKPTELTN